jgi:hypothetical protein
VFVANAPLHLNLQPHSAFGGDITSIGELADWLTGQLARMGTLKGRSRRNEEKKEWQVPSQNLPFIPSPARRNDRKD